MPLPGALGGRLDTAAGLAMRGLIRCYQLGIAPILPPSCRFYPSCSHYAAEAISCHGPWRGLGLALHRLGRCHPWGGGGYDPVPNRGTHRPSAT
jgi:putative membrane protein insertion efficiency factor